MKRIRELLILILIIFIAIVLHWRWLVTKDVKVAHDTLRFYGIFAHFASSLINGEMPLWNPYTNCGEPFFPVIYVLRLWDPQTILLILLFKFKLIKATLFHLYQIDLFIRYLILILGGYLFFRHILKHRISALAAFIVFAFSSVGTTYLTQHAFILVSYLAPWVLLFTVKMLEQRDLSSYVLFAFFLGLALISYNSMFLLVFLLIFVMAIFSTNVLGARVKVFLKNYKNIIISFSILLLMSFNVVLVMKYYKNYTLPVAKEMVSYKAFSGSLDFMGLFLPNYFIDDFISYLVTYLTRGASEAYLYIGLLPLVFLFLGIFYSDNRYKVVFLIMTFILIFLMQGVFYPLFCVIPLFNIIRNMHTFCYFFIFCLCFFVGIGADAVIDAISIEKEKSLESFKKPFFIINIIVISLYLVYIINIRKHFPADGRVLLKVLYFTLIFVFYSFFSFKFLGCREIGVNRRFGTVILFILIDLFMSSYHNIEYMTIPKATPGFPRLPKAIQQVKYPTYRTWEWEMPDDKFGRFSYDSILYKRHIGNIPYTTVHDLHFIELKGYNKIKKSRMSNGVRDVIAGIRQPILRLVPQCVVLEDDNILENIDTEIAEQVVFFSEDIPREFKHLKTELKTVDAPIYDVIPKDAEMRQLLVDKLGLSHFLQSPIKVFPWHFRQFRIKDKKDIKNLGRIEVLEYKENEVLLTVDSKQDAILYFSDGYDKYWEAYIDGIKIKIYKANLDFKAVLVEKGEHRVHFLYNPRFYRFSIYVYLVAVISVPLLLIWKYKYG